MTNDPDLLGELASRALDGDRSALELLCRELQGPMFRHALRILGDAADASDAAQEILLQIATHLSQFRGESRLLTWAYAIATRHLLRARSRLARGRSMELVEAKIRSGLALTEAVSEQGADARADAHAMALHCTSAMLQSMSVDERVAIVLDELGADEALGARLCDVSPLAFRKRLSRGRQKLRPILEELCGLARAEAPCTCERQVHAMKIAAVQTKPRRQLPIVDDADVVRTRDALTALRRMPPIFAAALVDPPEDVWRELQRRLPTLLGGAS